MRLYQKQRPSRVTSCLVKENTVATTRHGKWSMKEFPGAVLPISVKYTYCKNREPRVNQTKPWHGSSLAGVGKCKTDESVYSP
jgi:hypothetical protein